MVSLYNIFGFHGLDFWQEIALLGIMLVAILGRYVVHAWIYAHLMQMKVPKKHQKFVQDHFEIHRTSSWLEWSLNILLVLVGVGVSKVILCSFIFRLPAQMLINMGAGQDLFWKDEPKTYTKALPNGEKKVVKKYFYGYRRIAVSAVGLIILILGWDYL